MTAQVLDAMDLEREKGITIKAKAVRMQLSGGRRRGVPAQPDRHARPRRLHLRGLARLAACEGALLVVDAAQGVEAQTLANVYLALEHDLEIIPVINKIDLPSAAARGRARGDRARRRPARRGLHPGLGQRRHRRRRDPRGDRHAHPAAGGDRDAPLRALIFDSHYDAYKGVIAYCRFIDGSARAGEPCG